MKREEQIRCISHESTIWDMAVIGGGATGLGIALDAALRGCKVVLFEASDFAKGTSSRSTKLVHGGVRYLARGDVGLVLEALYERGLMLRNAPHLVKNQSFIIPFYNWWEGFLYGVGLTLYDLLAGKQSFGRSKLIRSHKVEANLPTLKHESLLGGIVYHDGQFDDARMAVNIAQSCVENGACIINYITVTSLLKNNNKLAGVGVRDEETGMVYKVASKSVINATGVFVDSILRMDNPSSRLLVRPSQGVHIVIDKKFLRSEYAIMIPKTDDGRVLFAIPWHNKVVIGTTDTLVNNIETEPKALDKEITFILETAGRYLSLQPEKEDVLSVFAGLRPLAAPSHDNQSTKEISRKHKIIKSTSGLITITGGKWTTYRKMAEDAVDTAVEQFNLKCDSCKTKDFRIHGYEISASFSVYGSDYGKIMELAASHPQFAVKLHEKYDFVAAHVIWAVREEMARSVEDVLARRLRILFLDARSSLEMAPKVAALMAKEFKYGNKWIENQILNYQLLVKNYMLSK